MRNFLIRRRKRDIIRYFDRDVTYITDLTDAQRENIRQTIENKLLLLVRTSMIRIERVSSTRVYERGVLLT